MRAESQVTLRWVGQKVTWVGLCATIGFLLVPAFVSRPDNQTFVLMGVLALPLAYVVFRLYRPGICTTSDALRVLRELGFNTVVAPISNGHMEATITALGAESALWGGYAALGSTRYLALKAPVGSKGFGPVTIRKSSSQASLLTLRPQYHDTPRADSVQASMLKQVTEQLDYLDVNVKAVESTLIVDVYGSFFQGPELRRNLENAFRLVQLLTSEQAR